MAAKKCEMCGASLIGKFQCGVCRHMNFPKKAVGEEKGVDGFDDGSIALTDVKVVQESRISLGHRSIDVVWGCNYREDGEIDGAGATLGSTTLLSGEPGAGKSTLALQSAGLIAKANPGAYVLYILREETPSQIALRARRIRVEAMASIRLVDGFSTDLDIDQYLNSLRKHPIAVILDSTKGIGDIASTAKGIKQYCAAHNSFAILIHHINKSQEISGEMSIQHEVDTTIGFMSDPDDSNRRILAPIKNRFGNVDVRCFFEMGERGLQVVEDEDDGEEDDDLVKISYGSLPDRATFDRIAPRQLDGDAGQTFSRKDLWEHLVDAHQTWKSNRAGADLGKAGEALESLTGILEACGFTYGS